MAHTTTTNTNTNTNTNNGRMLSCRIVTITLRSARNLPNPRHVLPNRIQAQITLGGDVKTKIKSPADNRNGLNPVWNFHARYVFPESKITVENLPVRIRLYSQSKWGDRYVGEVNTGLRDLFTSKEAVGSTSSTDTTRSADSVDFRLTGVAAAATNGVLNISYSFGEPFLLEEGVLERMANNNEGGGLAGLAHIVGDAVTSALQIVNISLDLANGGEDLRFVGA